MQLSPKQTELLALCLIEDLDWHLIAREAQRPGGLDRLLSGRFKEAPLGRSATLAAASRALKNALPDFGRLRVTARERAKSADNVGARLTTVLDDDYPLALRRIFNLPPFLFYRGSLDQDDVYSVAVVGTRDATREGLVRARHMASGLVGRSVCVVSGLAKGIDTAAHRAALDAGGRTVAVIGTGICRAYPRENAELGEEIASKGALVSQFWPETSPTTYTFPRRNVTMSGFGQGTVVIEASATSGAKMQARKALEHGKKVFLIRSLVDSHTWAQKYLDRGAVVVDGVDDVVQRLLDVDEFQKRFCTGEQLSLEFR